MSHPANPNLSHDIFATLKERIIRWEYPPGHRFTEESLCTEFGVSRSPVREALHMLVENHLVDKAPHRGYSVKQLDIDEILQFYDVRIALETYVVERLSEQSMPEMEWQELHSTWSMLLTKPPAEFEPLAEHDEHFHETLALATHNKMLFQTLKGINERLHFSRMTDITTDERLQRTCQQHLRILECIAEHNAECAREAMRQNIEEGRTNVEAAVKEALARAYMGRGKST